MSWITNRPAPVEVFAVEPTCAQLVWMRAGPGQLQIETQLRDLVPGTRSPHRMTVEADGGPGSVIVDALTPGTEYHLTVKGPGLALRDVAHRFATPPVPPGERLCRIVTVNDAHIGSDRFGFLKTIREKPGNDDDPASACLTVATAAMATWQPDLAVFKGDIVDEGTQGEWHQARSAMDSVGCQAVYLLGNHEGNRKYGIDPHIGAATAGIDVSEPVRSTEVNGVRVVTADTTIIGTNKGGISHLSDGIVDAAAGAGGPVLVFLHHNLQQRRFPTFLPLGIRGDHASDLINRLESTNDRLFVATGHTHRNRRLTISKTPVIETGSSKDYPGVWTGYDVYSGGIRQVSYRVDEPRCLLWTHRTRKAAFGAWGRWAKGQLSDRCFIHVWPS